MYEKIKAAQNFLAFIAIIAAAPAFAILTFGGCGKNAGQTESDSDETDSADWDEVEKPLYTTDCEPWQKDDKIAYYHRSGGMTWTSVFLIERDLTFSYAFSWRRISQQYPLSDYDLVVTATIKESDVDDLRQNLQDILGDMHCAQFEQMSCCDGVVGEFDFKSGDDAWSFYTRTCLAGVPTDIYRKMDKIFSFLDDWSFKTAQKYVGTKSFGEDCQDSVYCREGLRCVNYCTKECQTNADCPPIAECENVRLYADDKRCLRKDELHQKKYYDQCSFDWECPADQRCLAAKSADDQTCNYCTYDCSADANACPDGSECARHYEQTTVSYVCMRSEYLHKKVVGEMCLYDYECAIRSDCSSGYGLCLARCQSSTECADGAACAIPSDVIGIKACGMPLPNYSDSPYCLPASYAGAKAQNAAQDERCVSGGQCAEGLECVQCGDARFCAARCDDANPCGEAHVCVQAPEQNFKICAPQKLKDGRDGAKCFELNDCLR